MFGFHLQRPVNDWPRAAAKLPAGAVFLSVDDLHMCRDAKGVNPGLVTVFRDYWEVQHPSTDFEANKQLARQYFAGFVDDTFWQQELWRYIDIFKEWNEYPMDGAHLSWLKAVCWVWREEYQKRYPAELGNKPLACISRPIGNDIPLDFARVVAEYGNILSYHNYTPVRHGVIYPDEWRHFSGRWTENDKTFKANGLSMRWIFTEGGPIFHNGNGHPLPNDGWLHQDCLNGDVNGYNAVMGYQIDRVSAWNRDNGNRAIGGVLFTSGHVGWELFQVDQPEMDAIADYIRQHTPAPVPPDPEPEPEPEPLPDDYLDVSPLNQRDGRWANHPLGEPTGHGLTIGEWGCLGVVYTMQAQYWGLTTRMPDAENDYMVSKNCFDGQYIQPGALHTAYPGNVGYHGFMKRENSQMRGKVREWLDAGRPVPVRVDFNPSTGPEDQHWVLAIGWFDEEFWMCDPWHGDVELINNRYAISGSDILEALFYTLDNPPEPAHTWNKLIVLLPQATTEAQYIQVAKTVTYPTKTEIAFSADTAFAPQANVRDHKVIVYNVAQWGGQQELEEWVVATYGRLPVIEYRTL